MKRLVVVGNGMAGARFVAELLARGGGERFGVTVFGGEPHGSYNRILLSAVLAGSHDAKDIHINPLSWYAAHGVTLHAGVRAEAIDLRARRVSGTHGVVEPYDVLVMATGSSPLVPPIDGLTDEDGGFKDGVFVFRTLDDCRRIIARARQVRRAAVIGGGLLGLEAARGLLNRGLDVHVVHLMSHLMETQLDAGAGVALQRQLERLGLHVHLEKRTTAVLGDRCVSGLAFQDGSRLDCDMVVIATGVRPNLELAARAGLAVNRAILVGDDLACRNAPDVYAIGECAEHRGQLYGLVAPLWRQADVLADRLSGRNPNALFCGLRTSTKLKVAGVDVVAMGAKEAVACEDEVVTYAEPSRGLYKKLIVRDDRLIGAIVIGDGAIVPPLLQAFLESKPLASSRPALLFPAIGAPGGSSPECVPDAAQICDCNVVTKGEIVQAVLQGARSLQAVSEVTRAGTGCGSCRPSVASIVEQACRALAAPDVLPAGDRPGGLDAATGGPGPAGGQGVTLNKIERLKREKDGLDILPDVPRLAEAGWKAITEDDRERLKWTGVFFRRQTPGRFMMRLRIANGFATAAQLGTIADISRQYGAGFVDITTRQQIQLREFRIEDVPAIWERLAAVGLISLQTGMDNIRNVVGCPVAGLTPHELFDASPVIRAFTNMFLRNRAFTNLPRKFNVTITGCLENCTHAETQDVAFTPAVKANSGEQISGFNVAVGGKMGSGGCRLASPLNVFVRPDEAALLCSHIALIFRDHGLRAARNRARLAFLIEAWGVEQFRRELERRIGRPLPEAGTDVRRSHSADHLGIVRQKQPGVSYVGLLVPVGRITVDQLRETARLAEAYGNGEVRITTGQNLIIPNVPDEKLQALTGEPLLRELQPDPPGVMRGLVSCTGIDYCHFALIETKELALKTARHLAQKLPHDVQCRVHWSGCPAGCGNHALADIGLLGKNVRVKNEVLDAVDVFVGGRSGSHAKPGTKILEDVPCADLPHVLAQIIPVLPYFSKRAAHSTAGDAHATPTPAAQLHAPA